MIHGTIAIDGDTILHWEATRGECDDEEMDDKFYWYQWRAQTGEQEWSGAVLHRPSTGAAWLSTTILDALPVPCPPLPGEET